MQDLIAQIKEQMSNFSKGQRLLASYIINHYDKAAFMTASRLGNTVGVSESTVVRFAVILGYDGYPQMQRSLQQLIRNRLTSVQRMEVTNLQLDDKNILQRVMNADIEKVRRTLEETNKDDFFGAVKSILDAKNIYVMGVRSSAPLAEFIYFYFNQIFDNVKIVDASNTSEVFEQIFRITHEDVFIGISFPRYSKRTVNAIKFAKKNNAKVVALTDIESSPVAECADYTLFARANMTSFVDSLVAPMSLVNALIVAIGLKKQDEIRNSYSKLERIWAEYDVFEKTEGNNI